MLLLGCHLSAAKGYAYMGREAVSIGANTFQFFTRNPRGGSAKALDPEDVTRFRDFAAQAGIPVILAHALVELVQPFLLIFQKEREGLRVQEAHLHGVRIPVP